MTIFESWRSGARNLACFKANESSRTTKVRTTNESFRVSKVCTKGCTWCVYGLTRPTHRAKKDCTKVCTRSVYGFTRPTKHSAQRKHTECVWPELEKCVIFWRSTLEFLDHEVSVRVVHLASVMVNDRMIHLFRRMSLMVNSYGRFTLWS